MPLKPAWGRIILRHTFAVLQLKLIPDALTKIWYSSAITRHRCEHVGPAYRSRADRLRDARFLSNPTTV
ncbi:protein of unknown function [Kyrpidia spormannii]|uniref:Uncharacterized protein n=1 Tax=Kyrpidia spormannii TaxID=2055160 RepID=A0ACA8ZC98_9BACL|nr:protein of unknown function [Kyrpidia spormannii]